VVDMLANAAFLLGLTLAGDAPTLTRRFAFQQAHHNFYRAAQFGWGPSWPGRRARPASGQTGAAWQRQALAALQPRLDRGPALAAMLERYLELQAGGGPVHTWPLPGPG
jgi:hypothetical protein